jgi:hypothetical protein
MIIDGEELSRKSNDSNSNDNDNGKDNDNKDHKELDDADYNVDSAQVQVPYLTTLHFLCSL